MMNKKDKPKSQPNPKKEKENQRIDLEKIFYESMSLIADVTEPTIAKPMIIPRKLSRTRLKDQILHAQTWPERDQLLRSLAAKCYDVANNLAQEGSTEQSLKWLKLVARLLGLSFTPKKLEDLEAIKKELEEVKAEVREMEGPQEDEEDGEG